MLRNLSSTAWALVGSAVTFVCSLAWGVAFAFPEPDATPQRAEALQRHADIVGVLMLSSLLVFTAALVRLAWRSLRRRSERAAASRRA